MEKHNLEYESQDPPTMAKRVAYILATIVIGCFTLPFALSFLLILMNSHHLGAASSALSLIAIALWITSGILGLIGIIICIMAFAEFGPRWGLVIATFCNAAPPILIILVLIALKLRLFI